VFGSATSAGASSKQHGKLPAATKLVAESWGAIVSSTGFEISQEQITALNSSEANPILLLNRITDIWVYRKEMFITK
jgi:hypothetical protein